MTVAHNVRSNVMRPRHSASTDILATVCIYSHGTGLMCTKPIELSSGIEVPCRTCDQCVSSRIQSWVARAMAEKAMHGSTFLIRLSYRNNPDGSTPASARVFQYADVQKAIGAIREAYFRHYGKRTAVSYIVCGERGSKRDRVHWHVVLFSEQPLEVLGKWKDFHYRPMEFRLSERPGDNFHWSLWPHGHVYVQEPDAGGMAYAMAYALKDQFTVVKSKGNKRIAKAENHGAGMFRPSKQPRIGERYLLSRIEDWSQRKVCPVSLNIKVPDYTGYWYVQGDLRKHLCYALHQQNEDYRAEYGTDLPQWNALIASVREYHDDEAIGITDFERLRYGTTEEDLLPAREQIEQEADDFSDEIALRIQIASANAGDYATVRACGNVHPCPKCWRALSEAQQDIIEREFVVWQNKYIAKTGAKYSYSRVANDTGSFQDWWLTRFRPSRGCAFRETPGVVDPFIRQRRRYYAARPHLKQGGVYPAERLQKET